MTDSLFPRPPGWAPPADDRQALAWLRLCRSRRVGPVTFRRLMGAYPDPAAALAALPDIARAAGPPDYAPCPEGVARAELAAGRRAGARLLALTDPAYPPLLAEIEDAPPVLWALGDPALAARPALAVVGARNASSLGLRMARLIAAECGHAGRVIVSGLARGVDRAAHEAALETGTIAVVAGGIDRITPPDNADLAREIGRCGLILTEQPPGLVPAARHYPRRNRIIAGLAAGVVVVEARARSGALITAADAARQGREVMAVPGHPLDARHAGCNGLIRDGATLVRGAEDVLQALAGAGVDAAVQGADDAPQAESPSAVSPAPSGLNDPPSARPRPGLGALDLARRVLGILDAAPVAEDRLARDLGLPANALAETVVRLEVEGRIRRETGGRIARAV